MLKEGGIINNRSDYKFATLVSFFLGNNGYKFVTCVSFLKAFKKLVSLYMINNTVKIDNVILSLPWVDPGDRPGAIPSLEGYFIDLIV